MANQAKKSAAKKPEPKKPGTSVAESNTALVLVQDQVPEHLQGRTQGAGRGSENVGTEDLVIPRLEIIQTNSPQLDPKAAEYDEKAKPGMLTNSVTNQLYGSEVFVVPVYYDKQWLVWKDKNKGGGFFGSYPNPDEAKDRCEQEGGEKAFIQVIDTPQHLCLLVNRESGSVDEVMISMPRTKAKVSRQWNSMVRMAGGDRFARVYRLTTTQEENEKGKFFNYVVAQSGFPAQRLFAQAEKLFEQISKGEKKVTMDVTGFDRETGGDTGDSEM